MKKRINNKLLANFKTQQNIVTSTKNEGLFGFVIAKIESH